MDAKPQRPVRAFKATDENIPPAAVALVGKTLHQRNKSSPALSTLMANAALKPTNRRAFADVSNFMPNNNTQSSKDDISIAKQVVSLKQKDVEIKVAPLQKPAQRVPTFPGNKSILGGLPSSQNTSTTTTTSTGQLHSISNNAYRSLARKSMISLKPASVLSSQPISLPWLEEALPPTTTTLKAEADPPIVTSDIAARPADNSQAADFREIITTDNALPVLIEQDEGRLPPIDQLATVPDISEESLLRSDGVSFKDDGNHYLPLADVVPQSYSAVELHSIAPEVYQPLEQYGVPVPVEEAVPSIEEMRHMEALHTYNKVSLGPISELGISEEVDDLPYDEEFMTAHSSKFPGDNTTGGATIVLNPRVTAKTERELLAAKKYVESIRVPDDIEDEMWDTSLVAEYSDEIFDYMRDMENRMRANPHYMDNQNEIQWSMRSVLVDWLVQVHQRFTLLPETLFLAINYVDRFLSCKIVSVGKLQLVGATALFIAAKYEEINCPSVREINYMVDNGYSTDEILKAERYMLSMLQFELGWPGPMSFLRRISKADDYDLETRTLAKYFLEVTVMDERFVSCTPSFLAAGAHCLARLMLRKGTWTQAHVYYSNYTYGQLRQVLLTLVECCEDPQKHHAAVYEKYLDKRYKRASSFVENEMRLGFRLPSQSPIDDQSPFFAV